MNSNSDNPKVGKDFQRKVLSIAQKTFNMPFDEEKVVPVGNPPKEHKFDVVSADGDIIIECKCYTWTNGGNVPSAKMSTLNEAVLYLRSVNYNARKILAMKKDVRLRTGESLAEYYCRIYGHLLEDIEVWEVAEEAYKKEVERFKKWDKQLNEIKDDIELNRFLLETYDKFNLELPWKGDFDTFMSDKSNHLVFS